jgi:DNA-binding transcriptional ArsR family regulator
LLSDPGRAAMLMSLMGDIALPAGELAMVANVSPQTASSHLSRLVEGRLLTVEQQGRHRYFRIANRDVASAIEALLAITPYPKSSATSPATRADGLAYARTCYSHLAGRLGVALTDALQSRGLIAARAEKRFAVTKAGRTWFDEIGIPISDAKAERPQFARPCLDWTERRYHLSGELGRQLLAHLLRKKWVATLRGSRALRVTHEGERQLDKMLGVRLPRA